VEIGPRPNVSRISRSTRRSQVDSAYGATEFDGGFDPLLNSDLIFAKASL
jgi:hypothetical protein